MRIWKKHLDQELIDLYFDRLFEEYGFNPFDFMNAVKDYALSSKEHVDLDLFKEVMCEDCDQCSDCDTVHNLEKKHNRVLSKLEDTRCRMKEVDGELTEERRLYTEMRTKYDKLKSNSVLFSMDEEGDL